MDNVFDLSDAYKELCTLFSTLELSAGKVNLIYEGLADVPNLFSIDTLPFGILLTTGDFEFDSSKMQKPTHSSQGSVPLELYYVRAVEKNVNMSDVIRADGALIARLLWKNDLNGTVDYILPRGMNYSDENQLNDFFLENDLSLVSVSVTIDMFKELPRWLG